MNKQKLRKILTVLQPDETAVDFSQFDSEVSKLKDSLKKKITAKTIDDVSVQLEKFKKNMDLAPLEKGVEDFKKSITSSIEDLYTHINERTLQLNTLLADGDTSETISLLEQEIADLKTQVSGLEEARKKDVIDLVERITNVEKLREVIDAASETFDAKNTSTANELKRQVGVFAEGLVTLKKELLQRINNIGGGSMNQKISINGSVMSSKYADFNLIASSNLTITKSDNNTTKQVDITLSATGGGGGGTPGGSDTQVQYNNAGSFGGITGATTNGTVVTLTSPVIATSLTASYATDSTIAIFDGSKNLISAPLATYPSLTELSYVKGVTSAIQTQLNGKQASGTYVTGATDSTLTLTSTTLGLNLANANTWTAKQTIQLATQQFTAAYDPSNRLDVSVGLTGIVTFDAVGSGSLFKFTDPIRLTYASFDTDISAVLSGNGSYTTFTNLGAAGGYNGGYVFYGGYNTGSQTQIMRMWSSTSDASSIGIGPSFTDSVLQQATARFLTQTRYAAGSEPTYDGIATYIANAYNSVSKANGKQMGFLFTGFNGPVPFDPNQAGFIGAVVGWQYDPTSTGYGSSVIINASNESGANSEIVRFQGKDLRTVFSGPAQLKGYTVATLPSGTVGDTAYVTDALAPTFLATIVGGGAVTTPVFYNGANWVGY